LHHHDAQSNGEISNVDQVLTLYSGSNCHLCEQAKALLHPLLSERGLRLLEVDIYQDDELREKYGIRIPVVALTNGEEKGWPFTAGQIGRLLDV
jgi:glutaredoxin